MHPAAKPDPTVVRLSTPEDILGALPHRLGFHPRESLVVVCLEGPRRRDRLVMRADLPHPRHDHELVDDLVARAEHAGATAALVVCYTDAPCGDGLARSDLVESLCERFVAHDVPVVEALLVRDGRWWSYHCDDPSCCPRSGTELATELTPAAGLFAAEAVARGDAVLADREALVASVEPSSHPVAAAVRAQARELAEDRAATAVEVGGEGALRSLTVGCARTLAQAWAAGHCTVDPADAALLALGMRDKLARDQVMTLVLDHQPEVLVGLFTAVAQLVDDPEAAPVCTVLAWAAYADGGGALAAAAAERALRAEPGYAMAELVLEGLAGMVPPSAIREVAADVRAGLERRTDGRS
ncbi:MAG TPA: DUF4192 domain-containing protein [Actinomycetes bacterium]|nr:DUF4192 domain-containing protein [Actinomycetes bacterium]